MKNLLFLFIILFFSCDEPTTKEQIAPLPKYEIIEKSLIKNLKASFDLRIEKQITKAEIERIANSLKSQYSGYKNYFIVYLLPNMKAGEGAWATSHFNPSLNIKILGLTSEEEEKLKNVKLPEGEIIGKWLDETPSIGHSLVIYKDGEETLCNRVYNDGSSGNDKLYKKGDKFAFDEVFDEYMKIENDGTLGWYAEGERFAVLQKIE